MTDPTIGGSAADGPEDQGEDDNGKLSFMTLSDDNKAILLNGEEKYSSGLPMDLSRRSAAEKRKAVKNAILNACNSFGVDYVSMDNVNVAANEIVDQLYQRPRIAKVLAFRVGCYQVSRGSDRYNWQDRRCVAAVQGHL